MTTTVPFPPAVVASVRATAEDVLHPHFEHLGELPHQLTAAILTELADEGWEIRPRRKRRFLRALFRRTR